MLPDKARLTVERYQMFAPGDLVVVGVSGGPDSVALLYWLKSYATTVPISLHVAHLNHMLRDKDSEEDARWVASLAKDLGLPATVEARDTNALRLERRLSIEDAARQARYEFFARVVRETGASCVAVAHTADDQVETVVLHWLRGAGLPGLRGMLPVTRLAVDSSGPNRPAFLRVVRPFLEVDRAEVESYLSSHGLNYRTDRTNLETVYLRNRIRLQLIPQLREYNPRFKETTLRAAELAAVDFDLIQRYVDEAWGKMARPITDRVSFSLREWRDLHPSLQRYLLRRAVQSLAGDLMGLEAIHVADALAVIANGRTGAVFTLPGGLRVTKGYDEFHVGFERRRAAPALSVEGQLLTIPGQTDIDGTNWRVVARIASEPCAGTVARRGTIARRPVRVHHAADAWHADLDYSKTGNVLFVRRRRPGDRFQPLGMGELKSLQDFLVDEKVPRYRRDDVPIVASDRQIVWIAGLRIDDRVKLTPDTKEVLCLTFLERGDTA